MDLRNDWGVSGNDLETFKKELVSMVTDTYPVVISNEQLKLMALKNEDEEGVLFFKDATNGASKRISTEALKAKGVPDELISELKTGTKTLMDIIDPDTGEEKAAFCSAGSIFMLAARHDLQGGALARPSIRRNYYLQELISHNKKGAVTAIIRKDSYGRKVFAIHSKDYPYVSQTILLDIIDKIASDGEMGKMVCDEWSINHSITYIKFSFPDKAEEMQDYYGLPEPVVPCLILETSDVGDCSVTAKSAWKIRSTKILQEECKRGHRGKINADALVKRIDNEIFTSYRKLPERLAELLQIDIDNPLEAVSAAFDEMKIKDVICERTMKKIEDKLSLEFSGATTAYDMTLSLMDLPSRIENLSTHAVNSLGKILVKAPFLNWERIAKNTGVFLSA